MTIWTAWVDAADAFDPVAHARVDFPVRSLTIEGAEGEAPTCRVVLEPSTGGWLAPARARWCMVSHSAPGAAEAVLLFRGRLVGAPSDVSGALVELLFDARNPDHEQRLADALEPFKVLPHYDPLFVDPARDADPVEVLDGWHRVVDVARTDGAVTIVDALEGARLVDVAGGLIEGESLRYRATGAPVPAITVRTEAQWVQRREDTVDLGAMILRRNGGPIRTLTEPHLFAEGWPKPDSNPGGRGWKVGRSKLVPEVGEGLDFPYLTRSNALTVHDYLDQTYTPVLDLHWVHEQRRVERLDLTLTGAAQPLAAAAVLPETIDLRLRNVAEPLADGEAPPIGDAARASFFQTPRGRQAAAHALLVAAVQLAASQRCIEVSGRLPGWSPEALALGTDTAVTLRSPRLPGGQATGKVTRYVLRADGGRLEAEVTAACSIGLGTEHPATPGTPVYATGWTSGGYQRRVGATTATGADAPALPDYADQVPTAGAVDLPGWRDEDLIVGLDLGNTAGEHHAFISDPEWRTLLGYTSLYAHVNHAAHALTYARWCRRDLNPVDDAEHVITVAVAEAYGRGPGIDLTAEG